MLWFLVAVYDVVEEKLESEPDFQYIPEKSPLDGIHQNDNALRESMFQLAEGLITGTVLAQFDVSEMRPGHCVVFVSICFYLRDCINLGLDPQNCFIQGVCGRKVDN